MLKELFSKLKGKQVKTSKDVNAFKESEKEEDLTKWNTIVRIVVLIGKAIQTLFIRCLFTKKLILRINLKNKMKYSCNQCDITLEKNLYSFDKIHEHEKTHLKNSKTISAEKAAQWFE